MSALLGSIFGGITRLAPEAMKLWDAKNVRAHELAMFDKQLKADEQRIAAANAQIKLQTEGALGVAEFVALAEAAKAQATPTGIGWVDAISSLMRPVLTFWWAIVLATCAMVAEFYTLVVLSKVSSPEAFLQIWGEDEKTIVAGIIGFWFVDRAIRKGK